MISHSLVRGAASCRITNAEGGNGIAPFRVARISRQFSSVGSNASVTVATGAGGGGRECLALVDCHLTIYESTMPFVLVLVVSVVVSVGRLNANFTCMERNCENDDDDDDGKAMPGTYHFKMERDPESRMEQRDGEA